RKQVGVTPKSCLRIMRFQQTVATIDAASNPDWSEIALAAGFYDQSHFIRDFKHFSGFTPDDYKRRHKNFDNYVPVG
ncbi:MAG: helix-turn-helix transcriptional regulator, partial [Blastocatellia bacterium]|nr:helix-turn-helix transcriptional regulator [Blastocatellia bacterium]